MKLKTTTQLFSNLSKLDSRMELAEREMRSSKLSISKLSSLLVLLFIGYLSSFYAQTETFSTAGTYSWVCPSGVTSVTVHAWGGGGAGGGINGTGVLRAGGGGGGGAYSSGIVSVTPGNTYSIVVGAGGTGVSAGNGNSGSNSTFNSTSIIAAGGSGGIAHTAASSTSMGGGSGGASGSCTGTTIWAGGAGASSISSGVSGGGGGGAGSGSVGGSATNFSTTTSTGGTGGTGIYVGGAGVDGSTSGNAVGVSCSSLAGGGSGARAASGSTTARAGGAGGAGQVKLTYVLSLPWSENFDAMSSIGSGIVPPSWLNITGTKPFFSSDANNTAYSSGSSYNNPRSGTKYMTIAYSNTVASYLYTPGFPLVSGTTYDFSFYFCGDNTSGWTGDIVYNTSQTSSGSTALGSSFITSATTSSNATYSQVTRSFVAPSSGTYYFAIKIVSNGTPFNIGFDDFSITSNCSSPSNQSTSFVYSNIAEQSMTLGWTRGNGNNVMIVAKAGSAPTTDPTSGSTYTANAAYTSGAACGDGYVVYSGTGTSVNLTGLTGGTTYHFAAYEFNSTGTCYNTTQLTGNSATLDQETWLGVTSTDWNTGSNWSSGYVPYSTTNVTIPSGTSYAPTIAASVDAVCKNLTINSSATLTENAPGVYYFAIYGNIICNGTFISNNFVELNGGLVSDYATISGSGDISSLSIDLGYDNNIGYYKLLNDITLGQFYLDSRLGNSIFDMNGYNLTVDFFSLESSTTFYQKTGILSIEDPAATIDDISFVEATGTTYFSRGTIWVASSDQTIPSITYYNLKVRANNGVTATIGSGSAFSVAGDLTVLNPSTAGGVVSLVQNVTVSGNTLIGTSGNALTLNLSKRIIGTGTFTMGNVASHAINISFEHATNFAITCSGTPTFYGTVTYTSASAQKVITASSYNNLTFDLAGTKTLFGNLDVNGNLSLTAGTFDVSTFNVNLAGDFVKQTAATFTANTATFTLDGAATQYVNVTASAGTTACDADITFYNLVIDGSDIKLYYNKTNNRKYNTNDFTVNNGKQVSFISQ